MYGYILISLCSIRHGAEWPCVLGSCSSRLCNSSGVSKWCAVHGIHVVVHLPLPSDFSGEKPLKNQKHSFWIIRTVALFSLYANAWFPLSVSFCSVDCPEKNLWRVSIFHLNIWLYAGLECIFIYLFCCLFWLSYCMSMRKKYIHLKRRKQNCFLKC